MPNHIKILWGHFLSEISTILKIIIFNILCEFNNNYNNYYDQNNNTYNKKINLKWTKLKYIKSFEGNAINDNFDFFNDDLYTIPHGNNQANYKYSNNSIILNNNK